MKIFEQIKGHHAQIAKLSGNLLKQSEGRMFLFVGPSGIGKRKSALAIAQNILCEEYKGVSCGKCGNCKRVFQGSHESILQLQPEGMQIKIAQAHEVIEFISFKSISRARFIIIDHAQTMNAHTANALLKVMEEPPISTYFFLIVPSSASVLPTIRSRAQIVSFKPVSVEDMKMSSSAPEWAIKFSQGSYERLQGLIGPEEIELRKTSQQLLKYLVFDKNFILNEAWREEFKERTISQKILLYWMSYIRDVIALKTSEHGEISLIVNVDSMDFLNDLKSIEMQNLVRFLQTCLTLEKNISANYDTQLLIEKCWVDNYA